MTTSVELTWPGGEHTFDLGKINLLRALQDACDAGPEFIKARLSAGQWRVDDVVTTIRLALEGGGMDKAEARKLTRLHVEQVPLTENVLTAQAILMAALYGVADEESNEEESDQGEAEAGETKSDSPAEK